ncbi:MAG: HAMP domain-containing histidine kinase [Marinifilaceae bacterium]|nr:HAMP domain-containing histidine kinase [Marinifilaceae bacterium]
MKLKYKIAIRLSLLLLILMSIWAVLFYYRMVDEINDEADDSLEDYASTIISRKLAGVEMPDMSDGTNNSYSIKVVDSNYVNNTPRLRYSDRKVYIDAKNENEPARVLNIIFQDATGTFYELEVLTPTFERADLMGAIFWWIIFLFVLLFISIIGVAMWLFVITMRPLYVLLNCLDRYKPGTNFSMELSETSVQEFRKLNIAAQSAIERSEKIFEQQKQFIGNASHELQTPLAIIGNRTEWLIDNVNLSEEQMSELFKIQRTAKRAARLNSTLLLLTKIDNGQFPESVTVNISQIVHESLEQYKEIYEVRNIECSENIVEYFAVNMNESLATTLISNLIKNSFIHSLEGGSINIELRNNSFIVSNQGLEPLDAEHIFDRFYQGNKNAGSLGLGLALSKAICRYYNFKLTYRFFDGMHHFRVDF